MAVGPVKLVFVVNEANFFLSHRLPLAREALRRGFDVLLVCGAGTGEARLSRCGIRFRTVPLSRSGLDPRREFETYRALWAVYREERPDIVHHVTIKPVIYGTRIARSLCVPAVVNAIPGMGFVSNQRGVLARTRRTLVNRLYQFALRHPNMRVIFQNRDDQETFVGHRLLGAGDVHLIRGAGVDLDYFSAVDEPAGPVVFALIARMLEHKGVREFAYAADELKRQYPDWRFQLVGDVDPGNLSSLTARELGEWHTRGTVEWVGHLGDVRCALRGAHVVCLPSYGGEGLPKSLLEAAATGRAMIATDVPGCREIVRDNVTGVLVAPRDGHALTAAMRRLGGDPSLRRRLGRAAREKAEAVFSVEDVVADTFLVYENLIRR